MTTCDGCGAGRGTADVGAFYHLYRIAGRPQPAVEPAILDLCPRCYEVCRSASALALFETLKRLRAENAGQGRPPAHDGAGVTAATGTGG